MSTITIQPGNDGLDGWIQQEAPTTSGGSDSVLVVGEDNSFAQLFRSCIKFDLSNIPQGSRIDSAVLTLTYAEAGSFRSSNNRTIRVYRALRSFTESLTWNTYDGTNNWGTAGCSNTTSDREATDIGSTTCNTTDIDESEKSITLTASKIQEMLTGGTFSNNGFLLKMDTESSDRFQWHSSESATSSKRPKLVINYTPQKRRGVVF